MLSFFLGYELNTKVILVEVYGLHKRLKLLPYQILEIILEYIECYIIIHYSNAN